MPRQSSDVDSSAFRLNRRLVLQSAIPLSLLAVVGCHAVGPDYKPPATTMPSEYGEIAPDAVRLGPPAPTSARKPTELERWWTSFNDPMLDSLVERAVVSNLDLRLASERILQARANRGITASGFFPVVDADGSYTRARASKNASSVVSSGGASNSSTGGTTTGGTTTGGTTTGGTTGGTTTGGTGGTTTGGTGGTTTGSTGASSALSAGSGEHDLFEAGFDASWELDVFGGVRRSIEAADANTQAAIEERRNTLITLLGDVANNYIQLRAAQRQLDITRTNLKSQEDTLELTRTRFKAGLTSDLDVANAEAQVATTASAAPGYENTIKVSLHALGVLLGEEPNAVALELTLPKPIPSAPPTVPVGLPSELLRRRPDIRTAERQLASATANIGVATADLFPRFSLTGQAGLESAKFTNLPNKASLFYSVGPSVSWNIFDAGRIRANIDLQNSLQRQALTMYQKTVLTALQEVDDALVAYDREQARRISLSQSVDANQRAVDLSIQLYTRGLLDFLSVLEAQRSLFAAQSQLVASDQAVSSDLVALYKALGGGWESRM